MRGAPWGGHLGRQTEPRWDLQIVGGVERSAMVWIVRWADGSALGSTDGEWGGVEWSAMVWTVRWADGAALGTTIAGGVEWSGAPWYGQLGGQSEPHWEIQMAGGVERGAVGWALR